MMASHKSMLALEPPPPAYDLDTETSILIARLVLDDIQEVNASRKGKGHAPAPLSDEEYALELHAEGLRSHLEFLEDIRLAKSIDEALQSDQDVLRKMVVLERAELDDHRVAQALSRGETLPEKSPYQRLLENPAFTLPS
jgi:hypothetical protein